MSSLRSNSQNAVQRLIRLATAIPWLTVCLAIAIAGLAIWYTVTTLTFSTSRNALASSNARYIQAYESAKQDFGSLDYIVVVIEPPTLERGKQFVQALAPRLRADTQHFQAVIDTIDTTRLEGKKLLYLSPEELRTLQQRLEDTQDLISDLADTPGLVPLLRSINQEISQAMVSHLTGGLLGTSKPSDAASTAEPETPQTLDITFLSALFREMDAALATPDTYTFQSPWSSFFLEDGEVFSKDGYLTSKDDRFLFILVDNRTTQGGFVKHAQPLQRLRTHIAEVQRQFPDVQAGVTGGDALNNDEMVAAQRDTMLATVLALVGVAVLFIAAFRQIWRPMLVMAMLIIALCWTLGLTTLTVGHLNILSVSFLPILIGLGIDFGIHLMARYGEERAKQQDFDSAVQTAFRQTGPSVAAAAVTTALAFYAVMLADFQGLAELGFIAGSGILLCLLASFTVLPAMLALHERQRLVSAGIWQAFERDPLRGLMRFPWLTSGILLVITLLGIVLLPRPQFDYNLLNLQAKGTESVIWEKRLHDGSGRSSWYGLSVADSLDELRQRKARFDALPVVERIESVASLLPDDQAERQPLVEQLAPYVENVESDWENPEPVVLDTLHTLLKKIRFKLQRDADEWTPSKRPAETDLTAARTALVAVQDRLNATSPDTALAALGQFQQHLMADFASKLDFLQRNVHPTPITLDDIPPQLRQRFIGKSGRYLLQIFARDNIWERDAMQAFVMQLQTIDPDITGPPVVAFHSIRHMQQGYARGGLYAFIVIIGIVLLLVRRLKPTLLTLLPMLLGGIWTLACMALLDLDFNMANLIILPLFLGIAVDNGIHMVHRMLEDKRAATAPLAHSTGKAIVLTSLTTMVGFGSLMVAHHYGIFSLGLLSTLAVGCSLIAALVALPLVLHLFPNSIISPPAPPVSSESAVPNDVPSVETRR